MKAVTRKKCSIYAHRGARKEAADNTRQAFEKALCYAIDGMETDVQLTKDEVSVLWHDRFLNKLGHPDKRIDDFSLEQLKELDFACYFNNAEVEEVLSLRDFVTEYRPRCKLQIEIKNRDWEDVSRHQLKIQQCLQILGSSKNRDVFISSFNLECLQYANQLGTEIPLVYACEDVEKLSVIKTTVKENFFLAGICFPIKSLSQKMVNYLHKHNKFIVTFTCNSREEIQKALDLEVDILITDKPAKAIKMRD